MVSLVPCRAAAYFLPRLPWHHVPHVSLWSRFVNAKQAQLRAASALRGLSVDEDLRTQIVARGGLVPLLRLSSSDDVEIQMEVCDEKLVFPVVRSVA